jgi:hypothetical protein
MTTTSTVHRPAIGGVSTWLSRTGRRLTATDPPTRGDCLGVALLLLLSGALIYGSHIVDGNFNYDDWTLASLVKYTGYWPTANYYLHGDHRPLIALYQPLVALVGSGHVHVVLAWLAFARVAMSFSVYLFLRTMSLERIATVTIALLVLLFPFSDSGWMYIAGSPGSIGVFLYMVGATVAVWGLRARPGRAWVHVLAIVLYVASVLMYELALVAICLTGALYLLYAPRREAIRLWLIDVGAMAITLLVTSRTVPLLPGTDAHQVLPISQWFTHAKLIYQQGRYILAASLQPFGGVHYNRVLAAAMGVVVAALVLQSRLPSSDAARLQLRRWLVVAAGAVVGLGCSWVLFVPSDVYYSPQVAGVGNRINALAGVYICTLAFAVAMLFSAIIVRLLRWTSDWAIAGALVLIALIGIGYARQVDSDKADWALASKLQTDELAALHRAVPRPAPGTEFVVFGAPGYTPHWVPIFAASWDLKGAVQLSWHDYSLGAYPVLAGALPSCGPATVIPPLGGGYSTAVYGRAIFVDAHTGAAALIRNRAQCTATLAQFPPGPLIRP